MRRHRRTKRLSGQLLFVQEAAGTVTLDCLLGAHGRDATLCTLSLRALSPGDNGILDVLRRWEQEDAAIEVVVGDGRRGTQVEICSENGRVILEPHD